MSEPSVGLKRSLSFFQIMVLGLGTILGAGIYVLIGAVAAEAGTAAVWSFVLAGLLAGLSGLCFCELVSRHPKSAGEAVYVSQAFGDRAGQVIGFLVIFTGITSAAVLARGFAGYLGEFTALPDSLVILTLLAALGAITAWGISESVALTVVITVVEVVGLILVIGAAVAMEAPQGIPVREMIPELSAIPLAGIVAGSLLAFYAFIGFEDMVNLAEEVTDVRRRLPRAILTALGVSLVLYVTVAMAALWALPLDQLQVSEAPMADVFRIATGESAALIALIGLFAVINGALVQILMASRVVYGMASSNWIPSALGKVHPGRRTPMAATLLVAVAIAVFALALPLAELAQLSSLAVMMVFTLISAALVRIKQTQVAGPEVFRLPLWVPILSTLITGGFALLNAADLFL